MVSIVVSRLRCLGQNSDQGHCVYVMLSRKTLDLHTGVYIGAAATKRDMTGNGKVHVSDPNFYGRGKT